ncbi:MAG: hypothetical protein M1818_005147 [Claussenomyces sp. TS43310]|nr:MAG: hypothetical protein M1818_005147 [Claussenomyces sp. TS43310]
MSDVKETPAKTTGAAKKADTGRQGSSEKKASAPTSAASAPKTGPRKPSEYRRSQPVMYNPVLLRRLYEVQEPKVNATKGPSSTLNDINVTIPKMRGQLRHTTMLPIPSLTSLVGKVVDESGNIVDENGDILGKATGLINDIAGKRVNEAGQIVDEEGNVLGKVGEITPSAAAVSEGGLEKSAGDAEKDAETAPDLAAGLVGKVVTDAGYIVDESGKVVGRVEGDITEMVGRPVSPSGEILTAEGEVVGRVVENLLLPTDEGDAKGEGHENVEAAGGSGAGAGEDPGGDPTDIYLNIQSTKEAITITIRVPTVFRDKFNR